MNATYPRYALVAVALLTASAARAEFFDGNWLNGNRAGYLAIQRGAKDGPTFQQSAYFVGYVAGVADILQGITSCPPANATVRQVAAVVSKYMEDNPELWARSADSLVSAALLGAFPCSR
jgi:hypothetical protein